jgi:hypothetical protein
MRDQETTTESAGRPRILSFLLILLAVLCFYASASHAQNPPSLPSCPGAAISNATGTLTPFRVVNGTVGPGIGYNVQGVQGTIDAGKGEGNGGYNPAIQSIAYRGITQGTPLLIEYKADTGVGGRRECVYVDNTASSNYHIPLQTLKEWENFKRFSACTQAGTGGVTLTGGCYVDRNNTIQFNECNSTYVLANVLIDSNNIKFVRANVPFFVDLPGTGKPARAVEVVCRVSSPYDCGILALTGATSGKCPDCTLQNVNHTQPSLLSGSQYQTTIGFNTGATRVEMTCTGASSFSGDITSGFALTLQGHGATATCTLTPYDNTGKACRVETLSITTGGPGTCTQNCTSLGTDYVLRNGQCEKETECASGQTTSTKGLSVRRFSRVTGSGDCPFEARDQVISPPNCGACQLNVTFEDQNGNSLSGSATIQNGGRAAVNWSGTNVKEVILACSGGLSAPGGGSQLPSSGRSAIDVRGDGSCAVSAVDTNGQSCSGAASLDITTTGGTTPCSLVCPYGYVRKDANSYLCQCALRPTCDPSKVDLASPTEHPNCCAPSLVRTSQQDGTRICCGDPAIYINNRQTCDGT